MGYVIASQNLDFNASKYAYCTCAGSFTIYHDYYLYENNMSYDLDDDIIFNIEYELMYNQAQYEEKTIYTSSINYYNLGAGCKYDDSTFSIVYGGQNHGNSIKVTACNITANFHN